MAGSSVTVDDDTDDIIATPPTPASAASSLGEDEHPWPYLAKMFAFVGIKDSSYKMKCLLCLPKNMELLAFQNSPSNLKKHIAVSELSKVIR